MFQSLLFFGRNLSQLSFNASTINCFTSPKLCEYTTLWNITMQNYDWTLQSAAAKLYVSQTVKCSYTDRLYLIVLTVQIFTIYTQNTYVWSTLFIMRPSSLGGGRILRRSLCPSVPLSSVTSRHLANYNDTHVLFDTRWGPHIVRPSSAAQILVLHVGSMILFY